jgi:hypothetical protein
MASAVGQREPAAAPALRCKRCGADVQGTCHTRTGYEVGYYVLHTGPTEQAAVRRRDDESPLPYRRLLEVVEVVSCPRCFALPEIRRLWDAFGDPEVVPS